MDGMGQHTALVNGHRGEDGSAVAVPVVQAFTIPDSWPRLRGPASDIRSEDAAPPAAPKHADGDMLRRASMWVLASGVAAIAAIVSYSHIYDLGVAHGGSGVPARLLPLSVDMLILVGELMLLHEADAKGRRFALGWVLVWSGILATLAANVTYGYQFGLVGALIWGWPAYSFILAAGGMVAVVKRGATRDTGVDIGVDTPVIAEAPSGPVSMDIRVDIPLDTPPAAEAPKTPTLPKAPARTSRRTQTGAEKAAAILRDNPEMSNAEVARRAGVSTKTVSRVRPKAAPKGQDPETP